MRLYHKLHQNPNPGKRATLIRNIGKHAVGMLRQNPKKPPKASEFRRRPYSPKAIFEEVFAYSQRAQAFHGLEVRVIGKAKTETGGSGYLVEHPWIPFSEKKEKRRTQAVVGVCSKRKAEEIGSVSTISLSKIGLIAKPSRIPSVIVIGESCCLAEKPELPKPGEKYKNGILLCGDRRSDVTRIRKKGEPESERDFGATIQDLYQRLESLSDKELALIDKRLLTGGVVRKGSVSKARDAYMSADPLSDDVDELKREYEALESELGQIRRRKGATEKEIKKRKTVRPEVVEERSQVRMKPWEREVAGPRTSLAIGISKEPKALHEEYELAGGGAKSPRALGYRYGEEEAERLAGAGSLEEEYRLEMGGRPESTRMHSVLNERVVIPGTPFTGIIWAPGTLGTAPLAAKAMDPITGKVVGHPEKFKWQLFDRNGDEIATGLSKEHARAGQAMRQAANKAMEGLGPETTRVGTGSFRDAILKKRPPPELGMGEHRIVLFFPRIGYAVDEFSRAEIKEMAKYTASDLREIIRWGLPTQYGAVEFYRNMDGFFAVVKAPEGNKTANKVGFADTKKALGFALKAMKGYTGTDNFEIEDGPVWTQKPSKGRDVTRRRYRNPKGKRRRKNPDLLDTVKDYLPVPFVSRPERKKEAVTVSEIPKFQHHIESIVGNLHGKAAYDFGFTFGVLRGIDTCGITKLIERRKIRRHIEQQMMDAVYSLGVAPTASTGNPKKRRRKNPEFLDRVKDVLAVPLVSRARRQRSSIQATEIPAFGEHIEDLAYRLNGKEAYDFGFTFGVLRGIDTCGITKLFERRKIRRRLAQEAMNAIQSLSLGAPGGSEY